MSHIGSPPAGWYTDPSGAHLARYWDGATWTEQVRDDVAAGVGGAVTGASSRAAATVAEVAQAVAAVAQADVNGISTAAPLLVVDDGTEPTASPWVTSLSDPTVVGTSPDVTPAPVESPASAPSAPMGPVPGWYPDPAGRHQARYWDGARWTERVADDGVEGADLIPEVTGVADAAAMGVGAGNGTTAPTMLDPDQGAWTAQLLGTVNPDGTPMSAGQASLATLPATETPSPDSKRSRARPSGKVRVAGAMVLAGGVAMLFGSGMEWMKVRGPRVGALSTSTGIDLGDGRITVVLAVVLAVLGAAIVTGRLSRSGGSKVAAMGAMVAGAAAAAVTAVDIADVADRASRLGVPAGAVTDVGSGLWICFVGALVGIAGGLLAFEHRDDRPR